MKARAMYIALTNSKITFDDLADVGVNARDLKFTLVNRATRRPIPCSLDVVGLDRRHEGVYVSRVTMSRPCEGAWGFLVDWWLSHQVYEISLEWYHIGSATIAIKTKGNHRHISNYALKVERV